MRKTVSSPCWLLSMRGRARRADQRWYEPTLTSPQHGFKAFPDFFITRAIAATEATLRRALSGALLGQLGATYLVLFLAMLGIGILQNPMFGDGTPGGLAYAFPDYGAGRVIIDGALSGGLHAWGEFALALGWVAVLGSVVTWALRRR